MSNQVRISALIYLSAQIILDANLNKKERNIFGINFGRNFKIFVNNFFSDTFSIY